MHIYMGVQASRFLGFLKSFRFLGFWWRSGRCGCEFSEYDSLHKRTVFTFPYDTHVYEEVQNTSYFD